MRGKILSNLVRIYMYVVSSFDFWQGFCIELGVSRVSLQENVAF